VSNNQKTISLQTCIFFEGMVQIEQLHQKLLWPFPVPLVERGQVGGPVAQFFISLFARLDQLQKEALARPSTHHQEVKE